MPTTFATVPGDYYGGAPGFDLGDVYGSNSWACRTLGIGCGSASPSIPFPYPAPGGGFPFPTPEGGYPPMTVPQLPSLPQAGGACATSPFRAGPTLAARAVPFMLPNPVSGKPVWFMPAGRPLLWSGDMSACRRVSRIAGRAARAGGRRRSSRRRRGGR